MKDKQEIIDAVLADFDNRIYKMRNQLLHNIERAWKSGQDTGYSEHAEDWKNNHELIDELKNQEYNRGYIDGRANGVKDKTTAEDRAYRTGMHEPWNAARKIVLSYTYGGAPLNEMRELFELDKVEDLLKQLSPWVAISKLSEYEERKKKEEDDPFPAKFAGCDVCVHSDLSADDMPCRKCKYNYLDYFRDRRWKDG